MLKASITGIGETPVGKLPGSTATSLNTDAALAALEDAGLKPAEVDGFLCAYSITHPHLMMASVLAEQLGISPTVCAAIQAGGASAGILVMKAAALVAAGICRHVLIATGDNRLTGMSRDKTVNALAGVGHPVFEQPFGITVPAAYALVAQRYMHEYGTSLEDLAHVAVAHRRHAARNPQAQMRQRITVEDVMSSRPIATPLRLLDCCLISDGGAAIVVSAREASKDLRKPGIDILGMGQKHTHEHIVCARSLTEFGCSASSAQAFAQADVAPADIDVAAVYDSFTITLVIQLESMGFFEQGETGTAAAAGDLDLDGRLPCNTHGGLLSYAHSGASGGMFHIVEVVKQLRGEATGRQVSGAKTGFVHNDGGILSAHCSLVLGRA
jgi:acetyl-CoA acetyltransferase